MNRALQLIALALLEWASVAGMIYGSATQRWELVAGCVGAFAVSWLLAGVVKKRMKDEHRGS